MTFPLSLAFLVHLNGPRGGAVMENTAAMDWFVLATLATFFFLLGCFAAMAWQIWRRTTRPEPHEKLLQELAHADADEILGADSEGNGTHSPRAGWEKSADWWQQS